MGITAILDRFYLNEVVSKYKKSILACTENMPGYAVLVEKALKNINLWGESAKNSLPYKEITPIDIKQSLSRRIFDQNQKNFRSLITFLDMI